MANSNRITPEYISSLQPGQIFVFGSNAQGMHAGGAARFALDRFGAIWGQGEGIQGQSYAIPTMEGLESTRSAITRFINYANQHHELTLGCSHALGATAHLLKCNRRCILHSSKCFRWLINKFVFLLVYLELIIPVFIVLSDKSCHRICAVPPVPSPPPSKRSPQSTSAREWASPSACQYRPW